MLKVNKILCPTDFSEHSYRALEIARGFARQLSAKLVLIHVVPRVPVSTSIQTGAIGYNAPSGLGGFNVTEYVKELKASARESLNGIIEKKLDKDVSVEGYVLHGGDEADEINSFAEDQNVDLIVLSTHGRTGLTRLVFGSVAEKVIRHANTPVLTVRSRED